jgi:hypothetical protein
MLLIPMQAGGEKLKRVKLLLSLCQFGTDTDGALIAHFVHGQPIKLAAFMHDLQRPNLARSIKTLNDVNQTVEQIKHDDLYHLTDTKIKKETSHAN